MEGHNQSNEPTNAAQAQPPQDGMISVSRQPPPTLLRINADNQSKRAICFFWLLFFVVLIAITITSTFLPQGLIRFTNQDQLNNSVLQNCSNPNGFDSNKIIICNTDKQTHRLGTAMINLVRENQFVIAEWVFMLIDNHAPMQDVNITINLTLYEIKSVDLNGQIGYQIIEETKKQNQVAGTVIFRDAYRNFADDEQTLIAYRIPQFTVRDFYENSLLLIVELDKSVSDFPNVSQIRTQIMVVNPQFTKYTFVIRYLFFASSLIACVLYFIMLCRIPTGQKILQQKIIAILSVLLVLFNDPFYPITVLYPNKASSYFSVFFIINFVIFLLLLWILFLDRMYYEDGQKQTQLINIKRLGYIGVTYIFALVLYTLIAMDHIDGLPVTNPQNLLQNKKMVFLQLATLFFIILGFAYIIFSYIRLCTRLDTLLWRNQLFLFFSTFFIVLSVAFFFVNGLSINYFMGNRILLLFTMMNMYTFYLQYMYSLSRDQRGRVQRGQVQAGGVGLLEVHSGDNDFVDLEFDNLSVGSKIHTDQKLQNFVDRNKKLLNKNNSDDQKQSPKYKQHYDKDLEPNKLKALDADDDKHTDFLNQDKRQQEEPDIVRKQKGKQGQKKKQDQFSQFSLDD